MGKDGESASAAEEGGDGKGATEAAAVNGGVINAATKQVATTVIAERIRERKLFLPGDDELCFDRSLGGRT